MAFMFDQLTEHALNATIFGVLGLALFVVALLVLDRSFSLKREVYERHNQAAAILAGAIVIGVAIIVASAVH